MATSENSVPAQAPKAHDIASWFALAGFVVATFVAAGIGGWLTGNPSVGWYASLEKPSFNPPNWVFGPVWTALYLTMAVAAWLVWRKAWFTAAHAWYAVQLALNVLWSALFFRFHAIGTALIEIVALWWMILATTIAFQRHSRAAALLLVPYLSWVTYAAVLNFSIWRLNA
jgi:benzodiazapine receptor